MGGNGTQYMLRKKISIAFVIFSFVLNLVPFNPASANHSVSYFEPALISDYYGHDKNYPVISGETLANTEVLIYDNLRFVGMAKEVEVLANGKLSFVYKSVVALSEGKHSIKALARNKTSMVLSIFSNEVNINIAPKKISQTLPAPTLIQPNEKTITAKVMPIISGLSVNNTKVNIYVDGILNGGTAKLSHTSGTANFAYKPFLNLSIGQHSIWAVAIDEKGMMSKPSNVLTFKIEEQLPAPIIKDIKPVDSRFQISALVKSGLKIRVFVDHKLEKEIEAKKDESGTANFTFTTNKNYSKGQHFIYLSAVDLRGKESKWSNIVYKNINLLPGINKEVLKEKIEVLAVDNSDFEKIKELLVLARLFNENKKTLITQKDIDSVNDVLKRKDELKLTNDEVVSLEKLISESSLKNSLDKDQAVNTGIEEILNQDGSKKSEDTGIINESKENQGKLRLNLIIFILFLVAVVAWIFWVNRELIKERREQNKESDDKESDEKNQ